ncbi:MAG: pseudouridine synthase [Saprospiraceae bacterium]|nr:pseudouridine synthase [Saprospiraceae bacterium]MDP4820839.1 pseudouridine synthase [Saprospiraceae bacterium]MDP4998351.1 pseudouridine synthase [Saprospiraceae bacterium]
MPDQSVSLNKYLSQTGICSRREADAWIESGRVTLNGTVAVKGNRVNPGDAVHLDGKPIREAVKPVYIALHKPAGITCTTDQRDPDNIIDFIKYPKRIFPIGRIDKSSTGLILLTNDGDIVNRILREENDNEKEYIVTVNQELNPRVLKRLSAGVPILGTRTKPCKIEQLGPYKFRITLTQGLNRQIRRMCEYVGYKVVTLKRIRVMNILLGDLKPGAWRELAQEEIVELKMHLSKNVIE